MKFNQFAIGTAALTLAAAAFAADPSQSQTQPPASSDQSQGTAASQNSPAGVPNSPAAINPAPASQSGSDTQGMSDQGKMDHGNARSLEHNSTVVKSVQQNLSQQGQQVAVDGQWGPKTRAAVKAFQQSKGIKANGHLDKKTLDALGVQASAESSSTGS